MCSTALGASANGTCTTAPVGMNTATCASPQACNGQSTSCPTGCASDADCATTHYCAGNSTCTPRKAQGNACNPAPGADCKLGGCRVCQSNNCVDGYCCNTGCTEVCAACDLPGKLGTCSALADGATPDSPGCSGYLCNGTSLTCASTCAGNGDCSQPAYYCSGSSCLPSGCTSDASCAADRYCAADGQCKLRKVQASACNADAGADCLVAGCRVCDTNNCVDSYCCNSTCTDKCGACNLATKGTCSPLADGATPDAPGCSGYLCNGMATTCAATCAGDIDCATTHYCSGGQCLLKACSTDTDCAASYYCASDANCKPRKGQGAA